MLGQTERSSQDKLFLKFPGPVEKIWRSDRQAEQRGVCVTAQDGNAVR